MEEMQFYCPHCRQKLTAGPELFGETVACPACDGQMTVPRPEPPPPPQASQEKRRQRMTLMAKWALVLGLLSLIPFVGLAAAAGAVVLACLEIRRMWRLPSVRRGLGAVVAALILAGVGILVTIVSVAVATFVEVRGSGESGRAEQKTATVKSTPVDEKKKSRTKQAWDQMAMIDLRLSSLRETDVFRWAEEIKLQYAQIDTVGADLRLVGHIDRCIDFFNRLNLLVANYRRDHLVLQQGIEDAAGWGALLGARSGDGYNPQQDAAAGALFFGLLGAIAAGAESEVLQLDYEQKNEALTKEWNAIWRERSRLSRVFTEKYGIPFPLR